MDVRPAAQPRPPHALSRRLLLGGAAGALGTSMIASGASANAANAADATAATDLADYPPVEEDGITITKVKDLTGPDLTGEFGLQWVDLGAVTRCPDGRSLYVFGDSFGPGWGENWRSPTALWSETQDLAAGVTFSGAVGGNPAAQLIPYEHGDEISTIIPSDVITIGDTIYLHGVVNQGFGNVIWSGIWTSTDNGATWQDSGARFPGDAYNKMWNLCTWELGDDGWVYAYTTEFLREGPMILHRVLPEGLTNPDAWEPRGWDGSAWGWGIPPTPVIDEVIGEMSLRRIEGRWVFTWLDTGNAQISAMILDHPTQNLYETERVALLHGSTWEEQDTNHVAQVCGSYVIQVRRSTTYT